MNYAKLEKELKSRGCGDVYACRSNEWSHRWSHDDYNTGDADVFSWEPVLDHVKTEDNDALIRVPYGYYWHGDTHTAADLDFERQNGYWVDKLPYEGMAWNGEFYCDGSNDSVRYYPVYYAISKDQYEELGYIIVRG